ncbi:MAG TPA: RsmB/NOP family class I SAM-dependent RNA methyltransferase [Exilispira sp.]|jgi:16S rRNA C967 or C1407 C5-methylase (RsmB/RsmF family)|nr:RsmB/NOP family class I SAM-dependent RNA methyltransferase [Exilispira sp.]
MEKKFNEYYEFISKQLSPDVVQKIFSGFSKKRPTTFRLNLLKGDSDFLINELKKENINYKKSSYIPNSYFSYNLTEQHALRLDVVKKGYIYLQSFSSMVPAYLMDPHEDEKILDMTAAPGGKTTLMCSLSKNKAEIYANELDKIRYQRLLYNIETSGAKVECINKRGEILYKDYEDFFDKVLLDAPCSAEGRFQIKDEHSISAWSKKLVENSQSLQLKLAVSALRTLKKGGTFVYSTCTLNKKENEEIFQNLAEYFSIEDTDVHPLLNRLPNIQIEKLILNSRKISIYRLLPSEFFEGFTLAKVRKL